IAVAGTDFFADIERAVLHADGPLHAAFFRSSTTIFASQPVEHIIEMAQSLLKAIICKFRKPFQ
ncbi:hypothetical protein, partial [Salmonella sp. s51228]|uniref:hypothetical protein n=1 Tax=Salmonella sp. s51228 TaxID=3159652 RepID=UPI003980C9F6